MPVTYTQKNPGLKQLGTLASLSNMDIASYECIMCDYNTCILDYTTIMIIQWCLKEDYCDLKMESYTLKNLTIFTVMHNSGDHSCVSHLYLCTSRKLHIHEASNLFRAMATRARNSNSVHLKWQTSAAFSLESRAKGLGRTSTTGSPLPVTARTPTAQGPRGSLMRVVSWTRHLTYIWSTASSAVII